MADRPGLFLLFDGHALVHRAYHAMPPLTVQRTGEPSGAVFGVATMLLRLLADYQPSYLAFAFDLPAPTFRHAEYADYKANRPAGDPDLRAQIPRVRQLVTAFGIPYYEAEGYEADDIIGTLSRQIEERGLDTIIVTGDQDTFQLIDDHISVLTSRKGFTDTVLYTPAAIRERYGIAPHQIPDLKALVGDPSDNLKGVPGIGEKTAAKLLQQFGSVEGILDHLEEVTPTRIREALAAHRDNVLFSKRLATIVRDAPVTLDLDASAVGPFDLAKITEFFREMEFRSLLGRVQTLPGLSERARSEVQLAMFPAAAQAAGSAPPPTIVRTEADLERLERILASAEEIVLDTETDSREAMQARLVGIALLPLPGDEAFYIPVGHVDGPALQVVPAKHGPAAALLAPSAAAGQLPLDLVVARLKPVMADPAKPKIAHNGKYDLIVLAEHGVEVAGLRFDTMIAAYLLNERALGLKELAAAKLGMEMTPISDLIGKGAKQISMAEVAIEPAAAYAARDVIATARCRDVLAREIEAQGLSQLFYDIEMPLVPVLAAMERCGIAVDTALLRSLSRELAEKILELEAAIYSSVGHRFNINSTQQLGAVLFEELKLPSARRTKTGYSTDAQVLEELRGLHPVVEQILEYRQLTKLKATYVDALPALINPKTGRIHTNFNQTVARTGRLSSSEPNLQNIPVRTPLGRRIRQAFIAGRPGAVLLSADYSQIELRVLAHMSRDPRLVEAFERGEDIHAATAAAIFRVPLEDVTPDQRRVAKTTNFGIIYGISDFGLAERTELSRKEAAEFIRTYFETYPGIKEYLERTKAEARQGRVQTLTGRYQLFSEREILSPNPSVRGAAERTAINMPIQGTAADIIKIAMIRLHEELRRREIDCGLLLQVHDELVLEIDEHRLKEVAALVREVMEHAFPLSVPLQVEVKAGKNWDEMTPVHG
ncbi:MAG: DNA polymerase I [Chloroflexota bacterium]|nr:DNA polymerase I [Dehalococcoidia bacterium]MDW8253388.1 DNA polymerase I [Chloroflexota bacterium]